MSAGAMAYLLAVPGESSSFGEWLSVQPFLMPRDQRPLFMRFPHGKIFALHARGTAVQTVLLKTSIVRLSASGFSGGGRAVLSLVKDPGIIDLSVQLSQPMSD